MTSETMLIAIAAFVLSALLTAAVRKLAIAHGILDRPNARSSHGIPRPRGGGVAIVIATGVTLFAMGVWRQIPADLITALVVGGGAVALVGFVDDRRRLSVRVRLAVHFAAAFWALACMGGLPPLRIGDSLIVFGWFGYVLGTLGIVWTLNLFNFMDGLDGIAASEGVFVSWAGAALAVAAGGDASIVAPGSILGAACWGFLLWNWPPASVFMGDVGSGFLGYAIAVLAVAAARENPVGLFVWLILGGVFFVDSTITFVRRLIRGERVHEAHRSHAYQWLARRWASHRRVTLLFFGMNAFWLFPCAWFAVRHPGAAGLITFGSLLPVCILAVAAGAGRCERPLGQDV